MRFFLLPCFLFPVATCIGQTRFSDNFESDISEWIIEGRESVTRVDTEDPSHKFALSLQPNGTVYAIIKNSDKWVSVRVEGEVYFPKEGDSYLGIVYNLTRKGERTDFGCVYLKGDGSYLQVNPRRHGNASLLIYEEFTPNLDGKDTVKVRNWYKFKESITVILDLKLFSDEKPCFF